MLLHHIDKPMMTWAFGFVGNEVPLLDLPPQPAPLDAGSKSELGDRYQPELLFRPRHPPTPQTPSTPTQAHLDAPCPTAARYGPLPQ